MITKPGPRDDRVWKSSVTKTSVIRKGVFMNVCHFVTLRTVWVSERIKKKKTRQRRKVDLLAFPYKMTPKNRGDGKFIKKRRKK